MRNSILLVALAISLIAHFPTFTFADEPKSGQKPSTDFRALFQMHYANRVHSFQEQNLMLQNVVLVGDSITEGFDVTKYFPGRRILNRGIGADVIGNALPEDDKRGLLKRLGESIFHCSATDAFILIGINDLGDNHTPEVMEAGYRDLLQQIKARTPTLRVRVQSVLPTRDRFAKHNANVLDFNARLKEMAAEFAYDYIDLHSLMADDKGELKKEFTADGLHLNDAAYKTWQAEINRVLGW
jgi:lysophospholipase L1-like esterase